MEQQHQGFSDITPKAGCDRFKKYAKSLICASQLISLISISKISTQKYFDPFDQEMS